MSYITNKAGITLDGGFKLDSAQPLDVRFVVEKGESKNDLLTSSCYPGMEVWDYNDNKKYIAKYDGTDYSWVEVTSVETSVTNGNIKINGEEKKVYEHPTTNGNKHIPAGGATGNVLRYDSAGTAKWDNIATLIIQKNGVNIDTFNGSKDVTANIIVPTDYISTSEKGANKGVATLDENGHILSTQLPSYVDDVLEGYISEDVKHFYKDANKTEEITASAGKIYVDLTSLRTYRWGGTKYAEISESLALGETSSTAYAGDKGKIAYNHSQTTHAPANAQKNSDITKAEIEAKLTGNITSHTHTINYPVTSVAGKTGVVVLDKFDVGLENVENKSSATIRGELTKDNVVAALGYTPPTQDTQVTVDSALSADSINPVQNKIIKAALDGKVGVLPGKGLSTNDLTDNLKENYDKAYTHSTTAHAPATAEPNQNAFSNIAVSGQTTIQADAKTDTLTLAAGSNISISTDATADKITINAVDEKVKTTARTSTTNYYLAGTTGATTGGLAYDTGIKMGNATGELIMSMCNVNTSVEPAGMRYDAQQKVLRFIVT